MAAPVLYEVRATIDAEREQAWNDWYDRVHLPAMRAFPGVVSARRYRTIMGDDGWQYVTCLEFESEAALHAYLASDDLKDLIRDYDRRFGGGSERRRSAYRLVAEA